MATKWISPTWRMPTDTQSPAGSGNNQSKFDNYSLDFGGASSDHISCGTGIGDSIGDNYTGGMAISLWFKADTTASGEKGLFIFEGSTLWGEITAYFYVGKLELRIQGLDKNLDYAFSDTSSFHHLLINFLGPSADNQVYLDGQAIGPTFSYASTGLNLQGEELKIGYTYSTSYPFRGKMSNFCVFKNSLSSSQISYLHNSGTPQNPMAIPGNSPIAYYDLGGSSTGSSSTLTTPNSSVPSSTVFNFSTSDVVESPHISIDSSFTVSAWINTTDTSAYGNIFSSDDFGSNRNWQFFRWNNKIRFLLRDSSGSDIYDSLATATETINDGKWHHVAATWDGTTNSNGISIYVDGDLSTQGTSSSTSLKNSVVTQKIGAGNTLWDFIGKISNCQLWNTNLSLSEVKTLYNNGVPLLTGTQPQAANLKAWYKLNIDTSTWNGSDWTIENNFTTPTYTEGLKFFGQYLGGSPNANYSGMRLTNQTISSDHVTYSFWYKRVIPTTGSSIGIVLTSGYLGGLNVVSGGGVQWFGDGATKYVNFSGNVGDGAWHHVLVYYPNTSTITHSDVKCYIDGVLQTNSYVGAGSSSGPVTEIRGTLLQSVPLQVELSNWSYFLSDQTGNIDTIYNGGTPGDISSLNPSVWLKYNSSTTSLTGAKGANYGVATDSSGNGNNGIIAGGFSSQSNTETAEIVTSNVLTGGKSSGMTTANLVNSDLTRSIPYSSYSMEFDGINDYISFPADASLNISTANHSMSFWLKTTDSGICVVSQKAQDELATWIQSSKIKWAAENPFSSTSNINDGAWKHICFVADGSSSYIYINGVLDATGGSQIRSSASSSAFAIGSRPGSFPYEGSISNWALFNKALTEDQILTIYNGGVPNDISSLSPVSWWSLAGDSYYNGNDWICPDLGNSGNNGTSYGMGGTELVGNGPGSTANGVSTNMNIPENLQGNAPNSSSNAFSVNMNFEDKTNDVPVVS